MDQDVKGVKTEVPDFCSVCKLEAVKYFCTCAGRDTSLCKACIQSHCLEKLGTTHSILPHIAFGPHQNTGFAERLRKRIDVKERGKEELMKNIDLIDTCQKKIQGMTQELVDKVKEFCGRWVGKLEEIKGELATQINEAVQEMEMCMYLDREDVQKPLTKLLWNFQQGGLPLVTCSVNPGSFLESLERLLIFERLPINSSADQVPDPGFDLSPPPDPGLPEAIIAGYFCPVCEAYFMKRNIFKAHIITNHPDESFRKMLHKSQDFESKGGEQKLDCVCQLCDAPIKSKETLFEHSELHSEKYPCPLCAVSTVELKVMECHLRKHVKETKANYQCLVCANRYKNLSTVKKHIDSIHQGISIDAAVREVQCVNGPSICKVCSEQVPTLSVMLKHAEIHSRLVRDGRKRQRSPERGESSSEQRSGSEDI